jgi:hypothetical protein
MPKRTLSIALTAWFASLAFAIVWGLVPGKVPPWTLEASDGTSVNLRDLGDREVGVLIYASKVACGGHGPVVAESANVFRMFKDNKRYSVRIVYGDADEASVRTLPAGYHDVPILLDPGKKLAHEMGVDDYTTVLYRPSGRIIEEMRGRYLLAHAGLEKWLDDKTK